MISLDMMMILGDSKKYFLAGYPSVLKCTLEKRVYVNSVSSSNPLSGVLTINRAGL